MRFRNPIKIGNNWIHRWKWHSQNERIYKNPVYIENSILNHTTILMQNITSKIKHHLKLGRFVLEMGWKETLRCENSKQVLFFFFLLCTWKGADEILLPFWRNWRSITKWEVPFKKKKTSFSLSSQLRRASQNLHRHFTKTLPSIKHIRLFSVSLLYHQSFILSISNGVMCGEWILSFLKKGSSLVDPLILL